MNTVESCLDCREFVTLKGDRLTNEEIRTVRLEAKKRRNYLSKIDTQWASADLDANAEDFGLILYRA